MPDRCAKSWELWREVEKQDRIAKQSGYVLSDFYKPFELAMNDYRRHFGFCAQCRAWVDSWVPEGEAHGNTN